MRDSSKKVGSDKVELGQKMMTFKLLDNGTLKTEFNSINFNKEDLKEDIKSYLHTLLIVVCLGTLIVSCLPMK